MLTMIAKTMGYDCKHGLEQWWSKFLNRQGRLYALDYTYGD